MKNTQVISSTQKPLEGSKSDKMNIQPENVDSIEDYRPSEHENSEETKGNLDISSKTNNSAKGPIINHKNNIVKDNCVNTRANYLKDYDNDLKWSGV